MTGEHQPSTVTRLLQLWSDGDRHALNQVVPLVYRELHALAAGYLRHERHNHTLQPTALVHEAYLRLSGQAHVDSRSRTQFFAIAANLMRQILVNHARRQGAVKRDGGLKVGLVEAEGAAVQQDVVDLIAL